MVFRSLQNRRWLSQKASKRMALFIRSLKNPEGTQQAKQKQDRWAGLGLMLTS